MPLGPAEWDPPNLSKPMPFPPPLVGELSIVDTGPLLVAWILGLMWASGLSIEPWWPTWILPLSLVLTALYVANWIRIAHHRLLAWPIIFGRHLLLCLVAPVLWWVGDTSPTEDDLRQVSVPVRQVTQIGQNGTRHWSTVAQSLEFLPLRAPKRKRRQRSRVPYGLARRYHRGGVSGWFVALLPRNVGRMWHASAVVGDDGVIDTSGVLGPKWTRWFLGWLRGSQQLVALLWLSDTGNLDLLDAEARDGVWHARTELFKRLSHSLAVYLRTRAFPVHDLLVACGEVGVEAELAQQEGRPHALLEWAETMVQRRLLMAVPAARRAILGQRVQALVGVVGDDGKLAQAGLAGERLRAPEVRELQAEAWGPFGKPALAIAPGWTEVETGADDPPPLGEAVDQPRGGNPGVRRHRTYNVLGLPDRVPVGYMEPLTGRRLHGDVAIHVQPVADNVARAWLGLKSAYWRSLTFGRQNYLRLADQTDRTLDLMRRGETKVLRVGIYATIATTQQPAAELALDEAVKAGNYYADDWDQQRARVGTEPFGRDPRNKRFWTDAQSVAAAWPGTGGIWVPGAILIGQSDRSDEPVAWNPWWEGDDTSTLCICGNTGSGKTVMEQLICARAMRPHPDHPLAKRPPPVIVTYLKPWDEWLAFTRYFGGEHYHLTNADWRAMLVRARMGEVPIVAFNLVDLAEPEQVLFLKALEPRLEAVQKPHRFRHELLYVIGEAWAWAQDPEEAKHLRKYALQVRGLKIGLMVDTQFLDHLLGSPAKDVIRASSAWVVMRVPTSERIVLARELDIGPAGVKHLQKLERPNARSGGGRATVKGKGIIKAHGLMTTLHVKRFGYEVGLTNETSPSHRDDSLYDDVEDVVDVRSRLERIGLAKA